MPPLPQRLLVTGANGNIGRALLRELARRSEAPAVRAAVRSQRAADQVAADTAAPGEPAASSRKSETALVAYEDEARMREAAAGCDVIVHLVGIIKEGAGTRYAVAHEESCSVLARAAAAAGVQRIVYLSIVGSRADSSNACLASKGRAEATLLAGRVPATILRVPMVLGRGDYATRALAAQSHARRVALVGGGRTLQQPIDVRDVVRAILAAAHDDTDEAMALDLGGPECLAHRQLVARAAHALGRAAPRVIPIPLLLARGFAALSERTLKNPPITPAMLGVLQHEDRVDPGPACKRLGIELTPLDDTLAHCLRDEESPK